MNKKIAILILVVVAAFALGFLSLRVGPVSLGDANNSIFTRHASTSQFTIAKDGIAQIAATSTCSARIVTTGVAGVGLSFNDQLLNASSIGHWQAASTTVNYAGKDYGCGIMRARADTATTLLITEEN